VVHDPESGQVTVFALNRSTEKEMELTAELRGPGERRIAQALEPRDGDLKAVNSKD
jgi:alpha-N-arabinofuranosidase